MKLKKTVSFILVFSVIFTAFLMPDLSAFAKEQEITSLKVKVSGTTVKTENKKALKYINEYRKSKNCKRLKPDKALSKTAYERAAMLAVNYSRKLPVEGGLKNMPEKFIIARGSDCNALVKKYKTSDYKKDKEINACAIANLKAGDVTFWVLLMEKKPKGGIDEITSYSGKTKKYSASAFYKTEYLKGKENCGEFIKKTVRYKKNKKYSGKLQIKNYNSDVNSYFEAVNSSEYLPIEYTSMNPDVAVVSSFGNVTAKQASIYKERNRYTPKKGDFVLFHWYKGDGYLANHVGVVYKVTSKSIVTIEGNTKSNNCKKSVVSKRTYRNYKKNRQIVGFVDMSKYISRSKAKSLANLAKTQIGKKGKNYYNHTKAWKVINGGKYGADQWCAIFCGWLMEQKNIDPQDAGCWSPSCTMWIKQCNRRATAKINARIRGTDKVYSYKITFKV